MGIKFEDVTYRYDKNKNAISNIDLEIKTNSEFISILGHTGSGKSTLLQHMNALILPTEGKMTIMSKEINNNKKKNKNINQLRRKVGFVFQLPEYQLFEETILKEVMFGPVNYGVDKEEAMRLSKEALQMVGIDESLYERSPFLLSGGQQKRVTIASILSMEPEIIILDEPTRGLDPRSKIEILDLFKEMNEKLNKTIILITHDMNVVANYSKRVIVMKESKKVFDGTKEELFEKDLDSLDLKLPTAIKISNEIKNKLGIDLGKIYNEEELISKIKELVK